jgi:hypothetical protein
MAYACLASVLSEMEGHSRGRDGLAALRSTMGFICREKRRFALKLRKCRKKRDDHPMIPICIAAIETLNAANKVLKVQWLEGRTSQSAEPVACSW